MRNTADVTGGKPIAVLLQSISGVSAINPLAAFYDIHGGKREVLFFYFVSNTTRDIFLTLPIISAVYLVFFFGRYKLLDHGPCLSGSDINCADNLCTIK
jgi:hypothetical protein